MSGGPVLFVDLPRRTAGDPGVVANALGIDAYRARVLLAGDAPFLAHGFDALTSAKRAAEALTLGGIPASAHAAEVVDGVPAVRDAVTFEETSEGLTFVGSEGPIATIAGPSVRCFVTGKIARVDDPQANAKARTSVGLPKMWGTAVAGERVKNEKVSLRLEIFAEPVRGRIVRIGVRQDLFDFSPLGAKKQLAAARNLDVLRNVLAPSAAFDDSFHRTEMARNNVVADEWEDWDPIRNVVRKLPVRSNRLAFDLYARLWFLHSTALGPGKEDHWLEL